VRNAVAEMKRQNMTAISADHYPGYTQPGKIGNYIPDAIGYFNRSLVIVEAESTEGLTAQHTEQQFSTFFSHATTNKGFFIVAVSHKDAKTAEVVVRKVCGNSQSILVWTF
jgi:hypothetical protein